MTDRNGALRSRIIPVGEEPAPMDSSPSPRPPDRGQPKENRVATGRFQCINAFIDVTMGELTPAERSVWLVLWRDSKPNGLATTSQASIARRAGVTDRAVRDAVKRLKALALLTVVCRGTLRRGPSAYRVHPLIRELKLPEADFR
jgi:Helix-turn-helix domain